MISGSRLGANSPTIRLPLFCTTVNYELLQKLGGVLQFGPNGKNNVNYCAKIGNDTEIIRNFAS